MNTKDLFKKEILDANAEKLGHVIDIDFDLRKGVLNHLIMRTSVFKSQTISLDSIDKIGDKIVLNITKNDLRQ
jgi:sporulation protein YlmC with PRC-barrel domain